MPADTTRIRRFALEVQPENLRGPWHAWLHSGGEVLEFETPLELLRHLMSLNEQAPPEGSLR